MSLPGGPLIAWYGDDFTGAAAKKAFKARLTEFAGRGAGLKDTVAERPNHSNLCTSEFRQNSVKIQEISQNASEILKILGRLNIF